MKKLIRYCFQWCKQDGRDIILKLLVYNGRIKKSQAELKDEVLQKGFKIDHKNDTAIGPGKDEGVRG